MELLPFEVTAARRPARSPKVAVLPTSPPPDFGSCTGDPVTTKRPALLLASVSFSKFASKKWPKWFVPTCDMINERSEEDLD